MGTNKAGYDRAWRARARAAPKDGTESWHGTAYGYRAYGCRCDDCRVARSGQAAAWRARVIAEGREPPAHGTVYAYTAYGCRCDPCRTAHSWYHRQAAP